MPAAEAPSMHFGIHFEITPRMTVQATTAKVGKPGTASIHITSEDDCSILAELICRGDEIETLVRLREIDKWQSPIGKRQTRLVNVVTRVAKMTAFDGAIEVAGHIHSEAKRWLIDVTAFKLTK
jgi:hypothetical protein